MSGQNIKEQLQRLSAQFQEILTHVNDPKQMTVLTKQYAHLLNDVHAASESSNVLVIKPLITELTRAISQVRISMIPPATTDYDFADTIALAQVTHKPPAYTAPYIAASSPDSPTQFININDDDEKGEKKEKEEKKEKGANVNGGDYDDEDDEDDEDVKNGANVNGGDYDDEDDEDEGGDYDEDDVKGGDYDDDEDDVKGGDYDDDEDDEDDEDVKNGEGGDGDEEPTTMDNSAPAIAAVGAIAFSSYWIPMSLVLCIVLLMMVIFTINKPEVPIAPHRNLVLSKN
jgi:hypothetical protein